MLPPGMYGRITCHSCLSLLGKEVIGCVLDPDNEGEISVNLRNHSTQDYNILQGDRIAQLICDSCVIPEISIDSDNEDSVDLQAEHY